MGVVFKGKIMLCLLGLANRRKKNGSGLIPVSPRLETSSPVGQNGGAVKILAFTAKPTSSLYCLLHKKTGHNHPVLF